MSELPFSADNDEPRCSIWSSLFTVILSVEPVVSIPYTVVSSPAWSSEAVSRCMWAGRWAREKEKEEHSPKKVPSPSVLHTVYMKPTQPAIK